MKCWPTHLAAFLILVSGTLFGADQTIDAETVATRFLNSVVVLRASDSSYENDRLGTGFVVSNDGFVVSNFHVVEGATQILAQTTGGTEIPITGNDIREIEKAIRVLQDVDPEMRDEVVGTVTRILKVVDAGIR